MVQSWCNWEMVDSHSLLLWAVRSLSPESMGVHNFRCQTGNDLCWTWSLMMTSIEPRCKPNQVCPQSLGLLPSSSSSNSMNCLSLLLQTADFTGLPHFWVGNMIYNHVHIIYNHIYIYTQSCTSIYKHISSSYIILYNNINIYMIIIIVIISTIHCRFSPRGRLPRTPRPRTWP